MFFAGTAGSAPTPRRGLPALLVRRGGDRPDALQRLQHGERAEVAGVDDQVRLLQALHAPRGKPFRAPRKVGVGDDREQHGPCGPYR